MAESDWVDEDSGDWVDEVPTAKPWEKTGGWTAGALGAGQGVTLGLGDEINGFVQAVGEGIQNPEGKQGFWERYRKNRDTFRKEDDTAQKDQSGAYLTGNILGGSVLPVPGGPATAGATYGAKLLRALGQGAVLGAGMGFGNSKADLTQGDVGGAALDTVLGGGLGAAGGALAEGVVAPLAEAGGKLIGKAGDALRNRAGRGIAAAEEMAKARARQEGTKQIESLTGHLGSETQQGSRMTENIRRIPGEAAEATPEGQAALMQDAAKIARQHADELMNQAKAMGLEDVPEKMGEFLSKGSKVDKAQAARARAKHLLDGAAQLEGDAERVLSGDLSPRALNANLQKARDIAMNSPSFRQLEGTVLSENLRNLPGQTAKIEASRAARDTAQAGLEDFVTQRSSDLLSGKAAGQRLKELTLRYALPLTGAAAGTMLGDEYGALGKLGGAAAGWAAGGKVNGAIGALAGAGLRPGLQALYRTATQYPAVQKALWSALRGAAPKEGALRLLPAMLPAASRSEAMQTRGQVLMDTLLRRSLSASRDAKSDPYAGR